MVGEKEKTEESFFSLFISFSHSKEFHLPPRRERNPKRENAYISSLRFSLSEKQNQGILFFVSFCFWKQREEKKGSLLLFFRQRLLRLSGDFKAVPSFLRREEERHAKRSFFYNEATLSGLGIRNPFKKLAAHPFRYLESNENLHFPPTPSKKPTLIAKRCDGHSKKG